MPAGLIDRETGDQRRGLRRAEGAAAPEQVVIGGLADGHQIMAVQIGEAQGAAVAQGGRAVAFVHRPARVADAQRWPVVGAGQGDGHRLRRRGRVGRTAVVTGHHAVGEADGFTGAQEVEVFAAAVVPAGLIDREAGDQRRGLRRTERAAAPEQVVVGGLADRHQIMAVQVGKAQRTAVAQRGRAVTFVHRPARVADAQRWPVVGAGQGDGHRLCCRDGVGRAAVVAGDHAVGEADGFAGAQEVEVLAAAVVPTGLIDRETSDQRRGLRRTEGAATPEQVVVGGLADRHSVMAVQVRKAQRTAVAQRGRAVTFVHRPARVADAQRWPVVGAGQGDRHRLCCRDGVGRAAVVAGDHVVGEADGFAGAQEVEVLAAAVVPTGLIDREAGDQRRGLRRAEGAAAPEQVVIGGLADGHRVVAVQVGEAQRTAVAQGGGAIAFAHRPSRVADAQRRPVVGAGQGDGHRLRRRGRVGRTAVVTGHHAVGEADGFTGAQEVQVFAAAVVPAGLIDREAGDQRRGLRRTERAAAPDDIVVRTLTDRDDVVAVQIGKAQRPTVAQGGGAIAFVHRPGCVADAQCRPVVGAGQGDGHRLRRRGRVGRAAVVAGDHAVGEADGFAGAQEVEVLAAAVVPTGLIDREAGHQRRGLRRAEGAAAPEQVVIGGLADGHRVVAVQVGEAQRTAVAQGGGAIAFAHRPSRVADAQRRPVVGAGQGDRHRLRRRGRVGRTAVVTGHHAVGEADGFTGAQEVQVFAAAVVPAGLIDREAGDQRRGLRRTERAAAPEQVVVGGLADGHRVVAVQVGEAQRPTVAQRGRAVAFAHRPARVADAQRRPVVGAGQGDGHRLRRRDGVGRAAVVAGDHTVGEADGFTGAQEVEVFAAAVVPAGLIDRETSDQRRGLRRTEGAATPDQVVVGGLADRHQIMAVQVRKAQRTAVAQRGGAVTFVHRPARVADAQRRPVVGAGQGDGHRLRRRGRVGRTAVVTGHHAVGEADGFTGAQEVEVFAAAAVVPAGLIDREAGDQRRGLRRTERAAAPEQVVVGGLADRHQIMAVQVGKAQRTAVAQRGRAVTFVHRPARVADAQRWPVVGAGQGDGHRLCCRDGVGRAAVVAGDHAVGEADGFAGAQEVEVLAAAVVPTGLIDREAGDQRRGLRRAEGAAAPEQVVIGGLADGHRVVAVQVGKAQRPTVAQGGGAIAFAHRPGRVADAQRRPVIGAGQGDGHRLRRRDRVGRTAVVAGDHAVGEADGFTGAQEVQVLAAAVVPAGLIDREAGDQRRGLRRTERAAAPEQVVVGGLADGHSVMAVQIGEAQRPAVAQGGRAVAFVHRPARVADAQRWPVVGAGQGDRHVLAHRRPEVVGQRHREHFGLGLARGQVLRRAVVQRVGPAHAARRITGALVADTGHQRTQRTGRCTHAGHMGVIGQVHVAEGEAAAGHRGAVFGHRTAFDLGRRHRRCVIGTGNGDGHIPRCRRSMIIADGDQVGFGYCLSLGQVLRRRVVQVVRPLHRTVGCVRGFAYRREHERTKMSSVALRRRERRYVRVIQVDVVKHNRAAGRQRVGRARSGVGVFGHRAGLRAEAEHHTIIHARKLHRRSGPTERSVAEANRIGKAVRQELTSGKRLELFLERRREGSGVVADLTVRGDPDLCTILTGVRTRRLGPRRILDQEVGRSINLGDSRKTVRVVQ
ncbi:hypothetical protein AN403_6234 [Pseudomonas fluorescens]|uniref:Uncharacterized protein n=1 Tax=Pseudomonas fluorescens TaxID=294 RepID=A0A0P8X7S0_PSEFL|nr:hypothetical protein AN403_6234 [Pseudomonas fluorescens]